MKIEKYLKRCQGKIATVLKKRLPAVHVEPTQLHKAMHYAALNGGKRLRAALVYAVGEALGANAGILNDAAAAVEMIHAYSLIHDDLPGLDNDDLRRGKPACHKVFGEATTIIAGDALQSYGFETLANLNKRYISEKSQLAIIKLLAQAIGPAGMAGGQELDMKMTKKNVSIKKLEKMYQLKTGCLLSASILFGALCANCHNKKILTNLKKFSECIGLAFQIHDDIIGMLSDTKTLGKTQGIDKANEKPVYPLLVGINKAKKREAILFKRGLNYLDKIKMDTTHLRAIAQYVIDRNY